MGRKQDYSKREIALENGMWDKFDRICKEVCGKYSKKPEAQTLRRLIYLYEDNKVRRY